MTRHPDDKLITYASTRKTVNEHLREDPQYSTIRMNLTIRGLIDYVKCEHCDDDGVDLISYNSHKPLRVECDPSEPGAVRYVCDYCGGLGFVEE